MDAKIAISVLTAFLISSTILVISVHGFEPDGVCKLQNEFFSEVSESDKKSVFILGSSHTSRINNNLLYEKINESDNEYNIFNLSSPGDDPSERIWSLNQIIKKNPTLVLYGVSFRDFQFEKNDVQTPQTLLPIISHFFANSIYLDKEFSFCTTSIKDSKVSTMKIIRNFSNENTESKSIYSDRHMPFLKFYSNEPFEIKTFEEIKSRIPDSGLKYKGFDSNGRNVIAFKNFISELNSYNIKIVIFSTPNHKLYLDQISSNDKIQFENFLNELKSKSNVSVYFLHEKYSDMPIWDDLTHIAKHENSTIFTTDLVQIILDEMP